MVTIISNQISNPHKGKQIYGDHNVDHNVQKKQGAQRSHQINIDYNVTPD